MSKREPVIRIAYLDWVYRQPLRISQTAILAYLVRRANKDARCWPEQRTIAKDVGCSIRAVVYTISLLKACGLISVIRQEKRGHGKCGVKNTYRLNYSVEVTPVGFMQAKKIVRAHDQSAKSAHRCSPTKVQNLQDQSARSSTEERHEERLSASTSSLEGGGGFPDGGEIPDFSEAAHD